MKRLRPFAYEEPRSIDAAVDALTAAGTSGRVLAGGTDLIVDMKTGRMRPAVVVNVKRIPDLAGIEVVDGGIRIGALTTAATIAAAQPVRARFAALRHAAATLASPPVRGLATIGGNVGRASPASDLGPALIVHGAIARIAGESGWRDEPVEDLYAGPGVTTLAAGDLITSFFVPDPANGTATTHLKLGKRGGGTDIALAGVSVGVVVGEGGEIVDCRIVLASLAPMPYRARTAEQRLRGETPTDGLFAAVGEAARADADPISDVRASADYRTTLAKVLTVRALRAAVGSAAGGAAA
jgi:carbon-monoxide dehydrogenase medium subunit